MARQENGRYPAFALTHTYHIMGPLLLAYSSCADSLALSTKAESYLKQVCRLLIVATPKKGPPMVIKEASILQLIAPYLQLLSFHSDRCPSLAR